MSGTVLLVLRIVLIMVLYTFLAWSFLTLWQDLRSQSRQVAPRQLPVLTLLYQIEDETRSLRFAVNEITVGRDPACDFSLDDKTVSAQHARLCFRQGQWWVEDLNSTNGTFLNEEHVSSPLVVTNGDQLRCGQVALDIAIGAAEPA